MPASVCDMQNIAFSTFCCSCFARGALFSLSPLTLLYSVWSNVNRSVPIPQPFMLSKHWGTPAALCSPWNLPHKFETSNALKEKIHPLTLKHCLKKNNNNKKNKLLSILLFGGVSVFSALMGNWPNIDNITSRQDISRADTKEFDRGKGLLSTFISTITQKEIAL